MSVTPNEDRPEGCRGTCLVAECKGSGCRALHDDALPDPGTAEAADAQGTLIVKVEFEKREGRHDRCRS